MTQLNWRIVDRYLAGEATTAEQEIVEQWLASSASFRMLVAESHRGTLDDDAIHRAAADVRARLERDRALPRDPDQYGFPQPSVTSLPKVRALPSRSRRVLKAAAAITLLLGGSLAVWQAVRITGLHHSETAWRTVTAPPGQRVPVALPDSSQVILSPGSTMRYIAAGFGAVGRREVRLEGEAYFSVHHDAQRPFTVRAGNLVAKDLGTQFVVRAYPEDSYGRVIVRQGLVGLGRAVVAPGQLGRLDPNGTPIVESADTLNWFAWIHDDLRFAGMPLHDALPKLSRWYNVQFRLANPSLGDRELRGKLPPQLDDDALKTFELMLGLYVTREGRVVTFHATPTISS